MPHIFVTEPQVLLILMPRANSVATGKKTLLTLWRHETALKMLAPPLSLPPFHPLKYTDLMLGMCWIDEPSFCISFLSKLKAKHAEFSLSTPRPS